MRPAVGTLIGLLVRRLDDARHQWQVWRRGARGSGVDRCSAGLVVPRLHWNYPGLDVLNVAGFKCRKSKRENSNEEIHGEQKGDEKEGRCGLVQSVIIYCKLLP